MSFLAFRIYSSYNEKVLDDGFTTAKTFLQAFIPLFISICSHFSFFFLATKKTLDDDDDDDTHYSTSIHL